MLQRNNKRDNSRKTNNNRHIKKVKVKNMKRAGSNKKNIQATNSHREVNQRGIWTKMWESKKSITLSLQNMVTATSHGFILRTKKIFIWRISLTRLRAMSKATGWHSWGCLLFISIPTQIGSTYPNLEILLRLFRFTSPPFCRTGIRCCN